MNRADVEQQLLMIAREAHTDPEAAANRERRAIRDVLLHISNNGDGESVVLCRAILRAWELDFDRGYGR